MTLLTTFVRFACIREQNDSHATPSLDMVLRHTNQHAMHAVHVIHVNSRCCCQQPFLLHYNGCFTTTQVIHP